MPFPAIDTPAGVAARLQLGPWQEELTACVEQLCCTSKLRDLMRRLPRMEGTLKRRTADACDGCTYLDSSSYSRVLQQLLTVYSHAMRLVNKQSEEQAASDALLLTAQAIKDVGIKAEYIISTASKAEPSRQQLVVTCVGESGVSFGTTQQHVHSIWLAGGRILSSRQTSNEAFCAMLLLCSI
jgi:hypothetical protein